MIVLGIETSCDETAAAVVLGGQRVLAHVVASQIDAHQVFGGVVPELAARAHIPAIIPVVEQALADAQITRGEIDVIAVTNGPGLAGSLLVGMNTAKALAYVLDRPMVSVNHLEAHVYANWLSLPGEAPPPAPTWPSKSWLRCWGWDIPADRRSSERLPPGTHRLSCCRARTWVARMISVSPD